MWVMFLLSGETLSVCRSDRKALGESPPDTWDSSEEGSVPIKGVMISFSSAAGSFGEEQANAKSPLQVQHSETNFGINVDKPMSLRKASNAAAEFVREAIAALVVEEGDVDVKTPCSKIFRPAFKAIQRKRASILKPGFWKLF